MFLFFVYKLSNRIVYSIFYLLDNKRQATITPVRAVDILAGSILLRNTRENALCLL